MIIERLREIIDCMTAHDMVTWLVTTFCFLREVYDKIGSWFGIRIVFPFLDPLFTSHYLNFSAEDRIPRFGIGKINYKFLF